VGRDDDFQPESLGRVTCIAQTARALKVMKGGAFGGEVLWVPLSVVHTESEVMTKGDKGELFVVRWWAQKEGHV
jgi:hypothetical protein